MNMKPPILAITMGDPAGVGPEIVVKALRQWSPQAGYTPVIVGSERALRRAFMFTSCSFAYHIIEDEVFEPRDEILLYNDERFLGEEVPLAAVDPASGAGAYAWLIRAIDWAMQNKVDAIVTAPLHKEALHQAGHRYPGHTEIIAERTGASEFALMLSAGHFRVAHVTCHVALNQVPALVTLSRVTAVIQLLHEALFRLDGQAPRIAVCALNPHGGEGGLFGDEEIHAIGPAVEDCRSLGIDAHGPMPSDSIYPQVLGGRYDGVVAMYHDQGHIPFKLTHFGFDAGRQTWGAVVGVNISLGMPIVRTSVDHGTAFDLAGSGRASEQSMLDAIETALKLAQTQTTRG